MAFAPLLRQVSKLVDTFIPTNHILTAPKHVLPLAGLTAGLSLVPKRSVYAEEPSSDPLAAMV